MLGIVTIRQHSTLTFDVLHCHVKSMMPVVFRLVMWHCHVVVVVVVGDSTIWLRPRTSQLRTEGWSGGELTYHPKTSRLQNEGWSGIDGVDMAAQPPISSTRHFPSAEGVMHGTHTHSHTRYRRKKNIEKCI